MVVRQCKFVDDEGEVNGGIYCQEDNGDEYIICMCCGGVVSMEDVDRLYTYDYWEDFSREIIKTHEE